MALKMKTLSLNLSNCQVLKKSKVDNQFLSNFLRVNNLGLDLFLWTFSVFDMPISCSSIFILKPSRMESEIPFYVNVCTEQS